MKIKTSIVDSFTNEKFKGNPAGVCILENDLTQDLMLSIASELGFSETAFVKHFAENQFSIRFFSPKVEIPLCGHATLASAKVLFENNQNLETICFKNIQNLELVVTKAASEIVLQFPVYETEKANAPTMLLQALGLNNIKNCEFNKETNILILEIESDEVLRNLKPNFEALIKSHQTIDGVLVTAASSQLGFDFESRYFWPWVGTNEDPVTGGTHTFLAKYWSKKLGKTKMKSFQCSERSGFMEVELLNENKMTIKSNAQIVFEGEMRL